MGCGETLARREHRAIECTAKDCPNPTAVDAILSDPETEHVVTFTATSFSVKHPLRERCEDALLSCWVSSWLAGLEGPPADPGTYRLTRGAAVGSFDLEPIREEA
jgi:hypothetical protein